MVSARVPSHVVVAGTDSREAGKMRHGMPPPLRRSLAWLADLSWSKEEREEFAQMSPFERYHASSTALDWTWTRYACDLDAGG